MYTVHAAVPAMCTVYSKCTLHAAATCTYSMHVHAAVPAHAPVGGVRRSGGARYERGRPSCRRGCWRQRHPPTTACTCE